MTIVLCILLALSNYITAQFHRPMMGYQQPYGMGDAEESEDEPDSGNWYEKLRWWKEAKRVYSEDVHDAMEQVRSLTSSYDEKKRGLSAQLDDYYRSIPVARLAAAPIINGLLEELKKELEPLSQEKSTPLKKEEKEKASLLEEQTKKLEGLKDDFEQFNTMVTRLHEAYDDVFTQQTRECDNYDERALESFERIEKVLDDEKARHYYDLIENSLENIRSIIQYLRGPFSLFIDQAWAKIQQLMPTIKTAITELDKQGIPVRVLTEKEKAEREAAKKQKEEARLKAEAEKKAEVERQALPWWKKIFYAIGSFFAAIGRAFKGAVSWIGGLFARSPAAPAAPGKPGSKPLPEAKLPPAGQASQPTSAPKSPSAAGPEATQSVQKLAPATLPLEIQKSLQLSQ